MVMHTATTMREVLPIARDVLDGKGSLSMNRVDSVVHKAALTLLGSCTFKLDR